MVNKLNNLRTQIDKVDNQLIHLLVKRFDLVKQIGKLKKKNNIPPLDTERWREVVSLRILTAKSLKLPPKLIKTIYQSIHNYSLKLQNKLI